jgi:ABC-type bacteriocin/lantibiotic exporter with double-glycine peptidase domain
VISLGCATFGGSAPAAPSSAGEQERWTKVENVPLVLQEKGDDCGAAALSAVVRYWGYSATSHSIETALGREDSRLQAADMETYARSVGLRSYVFYGTMKDVVHELERGRPVIVGLGKMIEEKKALSHYEVVVGYEPTKKQVLLLDPGKGFQVASLDSFAREWAVSKGVTMVAMPENRVVGPDAKSIASERALASNEELKSYSTRESTSPDAQKYRAGDVIVITGSALAVILLV